MPGETEFENLVTRFYAPLYQFAFSLTRSEADACDLTQQTFEVWARKGNQLRDAGKVKTWLFTTLHREFLGSRRREARFTHLDIDTAEPELPTISPVGLSLIDAGQVMEALGRLDEVFQAPVSLCYLQDFSYNEIASLLEVPLGTVKSRLARGIFQLQQILARDIATDQSPPPKTP